MIKSIRKREGNVVPFDKSRITTAILKAMIAASEGTEEDAEKVCDRVVKEMEKKYSGGRDIPTVEGIQDIVEQETILADFPKAAKAYILYRQERGRLREQSRKIPERVKELADQSKKYFRNALAEFVYYRSYARWIEDENRRETWIETVQRYMDFMKENMGDKIKEEEYKELHEAILKQEVMPSMRLMWASGPAARKSNVAAYNCSFIAPTKLRDFAEILYILMCGTGVGFSVEQQTVQKLPQIKRQTGKKLAPVPVEDSKEGWADALLAGMEAWFDGKDVSFDYSTIRPAGSRLRTMGGKSAGPGPLRQVLDFCRRKILARQGRRLTSLDVHDIICKIGEVVVMGGVRRSALLSLSDLDDQEMRDCKKGQFYLTEPQRSMANNSTAYSEKPGSVQFLDEWMALAKSGTGERGLLNRGGLKYQMPARRWKGFEKDVATAGTNPCGEIILKSKEFCNLTEVIARDGETKKTLLEKVRLATILGTYQATLTNFQYLSKEWKKNCEDERLLGVSITGQWDCDVVRKKETLEAMREEAIAVNKVYAKRFGINAARAITCVKPSGTVSQLVDAASGLHSRYAPYYIRRVRISATDSLFRMLRDQKVPYYPEVGQTLDTATTYVLEFPIKAPSDSNFRKDFTALEQLEYWKLVKTSFTEHNPSVTITVGENEWLLVAHWLYENWDMVGGLSFLPKEDHAYALAPYEEISKEVYQDLVSRIPTIDFAQILLYEKEDESKGSHELACVAGGCDK
ncbi:MAG: ATP cone domain-containing protein [Candidatus Pacebacteria bacterium]|nr:ATP cone domain-containing protein [Candidatus Paceibacterota bacterium]